MRWSTLTSPCHLQANEARRRIEAINAELAKRQMPGMIERFTTQFPEGFYGGRHFEEERNYKVAASDYCQEAFSEPEMKRILETEDWSELFHRVKKLVSMTNLIQGSFEKPKLLDAIKDAKHAENFYHALYAHLHGGGTPSERLGRFAEVLEQMDLLKWTYATYFLFLNEPAVCMFVKPEGIKKSIQLACYPLVYDSTPSAVLYAEILKFSEWLKDQISKLEPRDMIDVQSFIWYMAPTGKHSNDK
ncbi:MAG: hypothetical protein HQM04_18145 [Magnetococcales bacterium]|nr:hypothetical protein [Magnetococcales bacterium]MBF0116949.1 hypothetical protein [Magnetococcales bacterium]